MASTGITIDEATLISTVLEGILYGFSVLMFMGTIWALAHKHGPRDINRPMTVVAILLLILSTAHMVVDIIRLEDGLVRYRDTFPGGPVVFFQDISQKTYVTQNAIYALQTLLGDGVVIYRCHVVWRSVWVIILPSMMWCGAAVSGTAAAYNALRTIDDGNIYTNQTEQWVMAFFTLTLSTNLISSGLLAYRIWTFERNLSAIRASTSGTLMHIVRVLVDAALLYSAALLPMLICFIRSNNAQYVIADMMTPIISVTFYMVLIRIAIGNITYDYPPTICGAAISEIDRGNQYFMKPSQVRISQSARNDTSYRVGSQERTLIWKTETMEGTSCNV
ncbi:hypothetical protein DEU56DRAFT_421937 [Suillus clintonianus]|uniref:uncharacterized protein n=1 Tax=Suillus clintonianus TaxID=1904413 RepID=UPI001B86F057|nr:uncharacterized protein DEU56DRAFT_421937 [Suillus clintonianus]KAG2132950.1 hypothetical protein DEU56DRAFT_421937 [Suillus clintonianus]